MCGKRKEKLKIKAKCKMFASWRIKLIFNFVYRSVECILEYLIHLGKKCYKYIISMPVLMLLVLLLYELINLSSHSSRQYICLIYYSFEGLQVSNRFISLIMSLIIIVSLIKYFCRKINYLKQWVRLNYATTHMRTNLYYTMRN